MKYNIYNKVSRVLLLSSVLAVGMLTTSCNDWLDVRPETEDKEKDQFASQKGFETALTGCYMAMAERSIYGERLTMTNIESLANLWYRASSVTTQERLEDKDMADHNYDGDYARTSIAAIYKGLFYTIVQANMIIKHGLENGGVIKSAVERNCIIGEAYAIRAYCQLDVLRLFGQMPKGGAASVMLPYSETTNINEIPLYYGYQDYVKKLKDDIANAKKYLKDSDPLFRQTFSELHNTSQSAESNEYLILRQFRMNYYAVVALEARMNLYVGDIAAANTAAMEIINAKDVNGKALRPLSGVDDLNKGYTLCPNECLFSLSKYNVASYAATSLIGGGTAGSYRTEYVLAISEQMFNELYSGQNISSHNRYQKCWNTTVTDPAGKRWVACRKYYFPETVENKSLYYQFIPMLRTSEMYLIAMETGTDLSEVNRLYNDYMISHAVANAAEFTSFDEVKAFIEGEYRREFFAEGQMFYTYKRMGTADWLWRDGKVDEKDYILPLPETEFNPNDLKK